MRQSSLCFQSLQKNVYITASDLFTCWDQYVQVLTKGDSPSQLLHGLNERNYRSRALKSARMCKNCKFWKQILKHVFKAWKETSIFHQRKNLNIFLLLRDFWPWLVCICHNCQKQQLFLLAIASKPQPRHQDLAYSNATTERNFCQGSICMINCC